MKNQRLFMNFSGSINIERIVDEWNRAGVKKRKALFEDREYK
ncbi:hypothetical protein VP504_15985 [Grimontia sp. NTOU-MAR1]|nr:hypothetical protein [Grimontia sp. NTOU-MAR1]WRV97517.1 hypothetical protein VP504_15985 [Grimontia sp. NTOU-MAR1]